MRNKVWSKVATKHLSNTCGSPLQVFIFLFKKKLLSVHTFTLDQQEVRDEPKLLGDSGEVPISKWSGWQFDSYCEIFSLLDGKN